MVSTPSPPAAPDPTATAQAQGAANIDTAEAQQVINSTNQVTPYGSLTYNETGGRFVPTLGGGQQYIPQETATTQLSPGMQKLFDTSLTGAQGAADLRNQLQGNAAATTAKPLDLGWGATEANLDRLNRQTLDPQWAQSQTALDQQLTNQGLTPGSEGWKYAETQFGLNKANAYNQMYLQGHNTATSDIERQYNSPVNTLSALQSQSQVSQPGIGGQGGLAQTPQVGIQPPNYEGIVQSNAANATSQYNAQQQASAQELGGLFGIGGGLLGGGMKLFASDEELKTDIQPMGKDPKTGVPIHAFRYKGDPKSFPKTVGPLASNVAKKFPGAVRKAGGKQAVDAGVYRNISVGNDVRAAAAQQAPKKQRS